MLENKLKNDVARFTNHESNLSYDKSGWCRLRKVVVKSRERFFLFVTKSVNVEHLTGPTQTCFATSDLITMYINTIMAAGHAAVRLLTYIFFVTSILPLGHFHHLGLTTCSYFVARRFSLGHQRVKLPILKWSKHGVTTISLPDVQHVVGEDFVLLCGDIHPHPGPRSTLKSSVNGTTTQVYSWPDTQLSYWKIYSEDSRQKH